MDAQFWYTIIVGAILGGLVGWIIIVIYRAIDKHKKQRHQLKMPIATTAELEPKHLLGLRGEEKYGFHPFYLERTFDRTLRERLEKGEHLLIIGRPLDGKTRAILEALKHFNPPPTLFMPRVDATSYDDIDLPSDLQAFNRTVIVFDDLEKYAGKPGLTALIDRARDAGAILIATCRSGPEYNSVCEKLQHYLPLFGKPLAIPPATKAEGKTVAENTGRKMPAGFNGIVGVILVPLEAMHEQYRVAGKDEKKVLESIKRLYDAGVYKEREIFSISNIAIVFGKKSGADIGSDKLASLLAGLAENGFFDLRDNGELQIEETYLQQVIPGSFDSVSYLTELSDLLKNDSDALFKIADHADDLAKIRIDKAAYEKLAIRLFEACLIHCDKVNAPEDFARTQMYLAIAYRTLAEVEDKAANCRAAIAAYTEALKVRPLDRFPMQYATTQNNLGTAYSTLAQVEDKAANCRAAIAAYTEALKVRTLDRFPMQYAMTQYNLAILYTFIADDNNKSENCRKARQAIREALKVYTPDILPQNYQAAMRVLASIDATFGKE